MWKRAPARVAVLCAALIGFLKLVLVLAHPVVLALLPLHLDPLNVSREKMSERLALKGRLK
jgi:hypothetical protein